MHTGNTNRESGFKRDFVPLQMRSVIEERNNIQYNKNNSRNTEKLQILWTRKRGDLEELHNY